LATEFVLTTQRLNKITNAFFMSTEKLRLTLTIINLLGRGQEKLDKEDYIAAKDDFTEVLQLNNNIAIVYYYRGIVNLKLQNYTEALEDFTQTIGIEPNFDEAYFYRGYIHELLEDYTVALKDFSQAIRIEPKFLQAYSRRGSIRSKLGDYTGALEDYTQLVKINPYEVVSYTNLCQVHYQLGNSHEAIADANKALRLDPTNAIAYLNRGITRQSIGDIQGAIEDYTKVIKIDPKNFQALSNRCFANALLGNYQVAITDCNKALQINPNFDEAYTNRCFVLNQLENYQDALADCNYSLQINSNIAETYYHRGTVRYYLGDNQKAIEDYQKAAEIYEEQGLTDDVFYQAVLKNISQLQQGNTISYPKLPTLKEPVVVEISPSQQAADNLWKKGIEQFERQQFDLALQTWRDALNTYRTIRDEWGEKIIMYALKELADFYEFQGRSQFVEKTQYQAAIDFFNQALMIYQVIGNISGEMKVIHAKGIIYVVIGNKEKAKEYFEQCLKIAKDIDDKYAQGLYLGNLADPSLYSETPQDIAEKIRQKAQNSLDIAREIQDYRMEWLALDKLGLASSITNNYQDAVKHFEQLLEVALKSLDISGMLQACQNLGGAYNELKNYEKAIEYLRQGVEIAYQVGENQTLALALSGLGVTLFKANYLTEAEEKLFQAIDIFEQQRKGLGRNDANKISIFETQISTYEYLQEVLVAQEGKTDEALVVAERGRAQAFLELLQKRLSTNLETLPENKKTTIKQIQEIAKTQKSTLVEYSIITDENIGYEKLYIWVIQPDGEVIFREVDLTSLDTSLGKLVSQTRKYMVKSAKNRSEEQNEPVFQVGDLVRLKRDSDHPDYRRVVVEVYPESQTVGLRFASNPDSTVRKFLLTEVVIVKSHNILRLQKLYQLLIDPISELLPRDTNTPIIFVPHKELFLVPFSALLDRQEEYLIDRQTILYAPAIQVLEFTNKRRQEIRGQAQEILVVGNPKPMPQRLSSLPFSTDEAKKIAYSLNTTAIVEEYATEQTIRQKLSNTKLIHLATHGTFNDNEPLQSAIALAPSGKESNQNGWLTATEILNYKLNAELVVLSGCDTGLGRITGDGVIGLSRCLFAAGVPSVIVSLWQVPDESTAELMVDFYKYWTQQTPNKAQALRQAMLETKKKYPYPEQWAAFILIGEAL
jgi:tetratricopeptide (TPR) repeat protein